MNWFIYMIRYRGGGLYTGITTDVERRFAEHSNSPKGAKALKGKGPLELVLSTSVANRSIATKVEAAIKKLSKPYKEQLINSPKAVDQLIEEYTCD